MTQRFDNYEIHPVVALDTNNEPTQDASKIVAYDQCEEGDPDLYMWSVYGHLPAGGIECIADCTTKDDAELIRAGLMERLRKPALIDAALLARGALEPRAPAQTINQAVETAVTNERAIRAIDSALHGALNTAEHILIPIEKSAIRRVLPEVDEERFGDIIGSFGERLRDDLLGEHLPDLAREVCGAGMRA